MYTVTLKEKGGTAKELDFDQEQITIGRIQGNDIVLPKGNISKSHAKIVCKDEKFIVADLKSTNGTFVNGKKIMAPQVVIDTDKIYIGDFVITLQMVSAGQDDEDELHPIEETGDPVKVDDDVFAMDEPAPPFVDDDDVEEDSDEDPRAALEESSDESDGFDAELENMANDLSVSQDDESAESDEEADEFDLAEASVPEISPQEKAAAKPAPEFTKDVAVDMDYERERPPAHVSLEPPNIDKAAWQARAAVYRSVFKALNTMDQALNGDPDTHKKAENAAAKALEAVAKKLEGVQVELWAKEIADEIAGLGVIDSMFTAGAEEILVRAYDDILFTQGGELKTADSFFSAQEALEEIAYRIGGQEFRKGEAAVVSGTHVSGMQFTVIAADAAGTGPVLCLRKKQTESKSFEELERDGVLSPAMTDFLLVCLKAKRNILICAANGADLNAFQGSLAKLISNQERLLVLQAQPALALPQEQVVSMIVDDENADALAKSMVFSRFDRVVASGFGGRLLGAVLVHGGQVQAGNIVSCHAGSVRHGLNQMVLSLSGYEQENGFASQAQVANAIDVVVHLARDVTGQDRVTEISEVLDVEVDFITLQSLFRCDVGASKAKGEGVFHPSGHLPRFYEDLQRWGVDVNLKVFKV